MKIKTMSNTGDISLPPSSQKKKQSPSSKYSKQLTIRGTDFIPIHLQLNPMVEMWSIFESPVGIIPITTSAAALRNLSHTAR